MVSDPPSGLLKICQLQFLDANLPFHHIPLVLYWFEIIWALWPSILLEAAIIMWVHWGHKVIDTMKRNRPSYDAHLVAWGQNTQVDNLLEKCLFWFSAKGMICSVTGQERYHISARGFYRCTLIGCRTESSLCFCIKKKTRTVGWRHLAQQDQQNALWAASIIVGVKYFHSFTCSDGILRSLSECVFSDRFGQEPTKAAITAVALLLECLKHPLYHLSSDNYVLLNGTV